mmetsp:Transcript_69454/g.192198  ORF Transcript_69454/g.192198 Transcript_69454/m.192198 type:complete len:221 (+) Transcript_69454:170-832(+)
MRLGKCGAGACWPPSLMAAPSTPRAPPAAGSGGGAVAVHLESPSRPSAQRASASAVWSSTRHAAAPGPTTAAARRPRPRPTCSRSRWASLASRCADVCQHRRRPHWRCQVLLETGPETTTAPAAAPLPLRGSWQAAATETPCHCRGRTPCRCHGWPPYRRHGHAPCRRHGSAPCRRRGSAPCRCHGQCPDQQNLPRLSHRPRMLREVPICACGLRCSAHN